MTVFQMVRIGDILDNLPSVDCGKTYCNLYCGTCSYCLKEEDIFDCLGRKQDDWWIKAIHDNVEKFGFWKAVVITTNFGGQWHYGDGNHRLTLLYLLFGEDGYIPVRFSEKEYMNKVDEEFQYPEDRNNVVTRPQPSPDTLPFAITLEMCQSLDWS